MDDDDVNWSSDEEWSEIMKTLSLETEKENTGKSTKTVFIANKIKRKYGIIKKKVKSKLKSATCSIRKKKTIVKDKESSDSDFSSSDNIPLSVLAKSITESKQKQANHNLSDDDVESILDSEDSYKPMKKDMNSSDSEYSPEASSDTDDVDTIKINTKKKTVKTFQHNLENSDNDRNLQAAKAVSLQEAAFVSIVRDHHERRLDELLAANGLKRCTIPADGNCFFQSAAIHVQTQSTKLRQILCDYMIDNTADYRSFFSRNIIEGAAEEDLFYIDYHTEVSKLREDGCWTTNSADLLPKVLADWSRRRVRIFSSSTQHPITDFTPVSYNIPMTADPIYLAYTSSDSISQHYDSCTKLDYNIESVDIATTSPEDELHVETSNKQATDQVNDIETFESYEQPEEQRVSTPSPPNIPDNCTSQDTVKTPIKDKAKVGRPKGSTKDKSIMTPIKKKLVRKRKATPETWKKNIRKQKRALGEEYLSQRGKIVRKREIKQADCEKCKYKCSQKINKDDRNTIFETFWSLGSYERQKDFIISKVKQKQTRTYLDENGQQVKKTRNFYRSYFFNVDDKNEAVCKKFFLNTLDVGETFVDHALKNQSGGVFFGGDKRGKHNPHNKTSPQAMELVRTHIDSFPAVEGHYTRKDSNRKYLGSELNITKMYELYLDYYKNKVREDELVSQAIYRRTFNEEYNYSFHLPKKDQCNVCFTFHREEASGTLTDEQKERFNQHQENKKRAREEKENDKINAKESTDIVVSTFDLQAVLSTPCSLVNQMYYNRKLSCYNLSIFNLCDKNATCYLWSEVEAKRGSCEIATCLYLYLLSLPSTIKHAIFYSDNCAGQNRNQYIATCFLHAVTFLPHIATIEHKFLEQGHTQMECDSMHSAIEFAKQKTEIYVPREWATIIRVARRKNPYMVVPLKHEDIWDFKTVQSQTMKLAKVDSNGVKVNWMKMKWMKFEKQDPDSIQFKYNFDEEFKKMKVTATGKRGRPAEKMKELPRLYTKQQPIAAAKKKDLLSLCSSKIIPVEYHDFFKNLPSQGNVRDKLGDPDVEEMDEDTDTE